MKPIVPGIYHLPLEFNREGTAWDIHLAAVETASGLLLVDTGFASRVDVLEAALADAGFGLGDVELVVLTHQDSDHAGALAEIRGRTGATTLAHAADAPAIAGERERLKGGEYPPARVDVELVDGVGLRTAAGRLAVVATPGHTPGHVSLYLPGEKLLLAGDAITAEGAFDGPSEAATPDMETAVDSVGRLAELDVERTLCFHGGLVDHGPDRLGTVHENLVEHHKC